MSKGTKELLQTRLERAPFGLGNQIIFCARLYSVILGYTQIIIKGTPFGMGYERA